MFAKMTHPSLVAILLLVLAGIQVAMVVQANVNRQVSPLNAPLLNSSGGGGGARMYVQSSTNNKGQKKQLALLPGLLDETLLSRGSFAFGARQVAFNKLKVLGNVYVNNVNGRPLRDSYLFKSSLAAAAGASRGAAAKVKPAPPLPVVAKRQQATATNLNTKRQKSRSKGKELRLRVIE